MTVMFEVTTASPKRPNFFTYCLCTTLWNCSSVMPKVLRNGETRKNPPRKELPCMRSCSSVWLVALRAMSKPGRMKMRISLSRIHCRYFAGTRSQAIAGDSFDSQTKLPPFFRPSRGLVWVKALGSQQSTTSTWLSSQFTLICDGATVR
jgi:hypothetical protein